MHSFAKILCLFVLFGCDSRPISLNVRVCVRPESDKMRENNLLVSCQPSENHTKRSNSNDFGFEKIIDFARQGQLGGGSDVNDVNVKRHGFWL